ERDGRRGREAEPLRDELQAGTLRDVPMRELEEDRQRLRDVEATCEGRTKLAAQLVQLVRIAGHDELRRRLVEPLQQIADLVQLDVLKACVLLRVPRHMRDVKLVVDVAVERPAALLDCVDRVARELERDRDVAQKLS